ncbi:MAG: excinuclease ABC subunit C [Candidatus Omnitrophica bacterium CG11_big_fil_rev_8_21_14_0_20_45_26]|uniref:Excinuclease ABC subunit C n=1 Tax=Candidatus Abzuiibacterium crystallinum TaxID=1974748 RepID=A0A2H0LPG8_9BACT|nr:MAG: excinuclease ABC subunit C [Candidatus Omnitrophica bacterium CG11_big_fil_rev_8_21_14_0_20_45_26]PIW63192.1 MAG: excinuclease ABC subunit C [Candidatus Omnitrophica bacterium CG12_big_fil_rev_8_21_14_0_65_45_16]
MVSTVYILTSYRDPNKVYIGTSDNLNRRFIEHNRKKSSYSKLYAPWKLETSITFSDKQLAISFEKYLKHGSGHAFLKKRLLPNMIKAK